jgi:hypothetical protein
MLSEIYLRQQSQIFRFYNESSTIYQEDSSIEITNVPMKKLALLLFRYKQRCLQLAWDKWILDINTGKHLNSLQTKVQMILQRKVDTTQLRTELEVETIFKWACRCLSEDPSSVMWMLRHCTKRAIRNKVIQVATNVDTYKQST